MGEKVKCEFCQSEIDKDARICPFCESVRIHTCFFCDTVIEDYIHTKTCPSCGKPYISYIKPKEARPSKKYKRAEGEAAIGHAIARAMEVNRSDEHIYRIKKLVLFGSFLDKTKEYIGNVNLAIYSELKDKSEDSMDQSEKLYLMDLADGKTEKLRDYEESWFYGTTKMLRFIQGGMDILHLHDGKSANEMAESSGTANYIYIGDYIVLTLEDDV